MRFVLAMYLDVIFLIECYKLIIIDCFIDVMVPVVQYTSLLLGPDCVLQTKAT